MATTPIVTPIGHGEYMPDASTYDVLYEVEWNDTETDDDAYAECVRFFGRRKDLPADVVEAAIHEVLEDGWQQDIIIVTDPDEALRSLMVELDTEPSGDDDTFDYWPSGVRLAVALVAGINATLDQAREELAVSVRDDGVDAHPAMVADLIALDRVADLVRRVADAKGMDPEDLL